MNKTHTHAHTHRQTLSPTLPVRHSVSDVRDRPSSFHLHGREQTSARGSGKQLNPSCLTNSVVVIIMMIIIITIRIITSSTFSQFQHKMHCKPGLRHIHSLLYCITFTNTRYDFWIQTYIFCSGFQFMHSMSAALDKMATPASHFVCMVTLSQCFDSHGWAPMA